MELLEDINFYNFSDDDENLPPEITEAASAAEENLIPTKSRQRYENTYNKFIKWCHTKKISNYSETVLLAYFQGLTKIIKSSTIWSIYSMIKLMLRIKNDVDIGQYLKLRAFLKKQNEGYVPKKSKIFTREQFEQFLVQADDENYLGAKVTMIMGIFGACRCDELAKMKVEDVKDMGHIFYINIPDTKTGKSRSFTIIGDSYLKMLRKYIALRPKNMEDRRFFVRYNKGKCIRNVIGIHKLGEVPREVASFLKLPHCNEYTGNCLRRTSATLLVDGGADITCLKRHGGWKSSSVAEGYIEESIRNKNVIANKICSNEPSTQPNILTSMLSTSSDVSCGSPSLNKKCTITSAEVDGIEFNNLQSAESTSSCNVANLNTQLKSSGLNIYNNKINNVSFHVTINNK